MDRTTRGGSGDAGVPSVSGDIDPKTLDPKTLDPKTLDPKTLDPKILHYIRKIAFSLVKKGSVNWRDRREELIQEGIVSYLEGYKSIAWRMKQAAISPIKVFGFGPTRWKKGWGQRVELGDVLALNDLDLDLGLDLDLEGEDHIIFQASLAEGSWERAHLNVLCQLAGITRERVTERIYYYRRRYGR